MATHRCNDSLAPQLDGGCGWLRVSRHQFSVTYDEAARLDNHSIDVDSLAPALLAFGKLIREANAQFNGKRATTKVVVEFDFEHKCFHIKFGVVVSVYEQVKTLLGTSDAKTALEIIEWLGILGTLAGGAAGATMTFLKFLKWKRGRKVAEKITDATREGIVEVRIDGDGNTVQVHNHIVQLSENPRALKATRDAFLPLGHDGFDVMRLSDSSDHKPLEIDESDVSKIVASCNVGIDGAKETEPEVEVTPEWLSVYSPVYDTAAENWRFRLGRDVIYVDITATKIAEEALLRGGALANDAYQVSLEIRTPVDQHRKKKNPQYKILEVVRFVLASPSNQSSLFDGI